VEEFKNENASGFEESGHEEPRQNYDLIRMDLRTNRETWF